MRANREVPLATVLTRITVVAFLALLIAGVGPVRAQTEAPTGFDDETNGFLLPNEYRRARQTFEHQVTLDEGLGPLFTARSCEACHGHPVVGGARHIFSFFAGHPDPTAGFLAATAQLPDGTPVSLAPFGGFFWPGAICPEAQLQLLEPGTAEPIRVSHLAPSLLGDGFVEAIPDATIIAIAAGQPAASGGAIAGQVTMTPVFESNPLVFNVGRFGWKSVLGSVLSFSAAASIFDTGITNRLFPAEFISQCDEVADPEDSPLRPIGKQRIDVLANFMRSTKAPPRDATLAATPDALAGEITFDTIGCAICHVATIETAPAGSVIHGGAYVVPPALGDKIIHPYSDFLVHDVGTGDGTVFLFQPPSTVNTMRTAPLWGLRVRNRLMHDGQSNTLTEAIARHQGEAAGVTAAFDALTALEKAQLIVFLKSL